jgi:TetR/AcrR family transcriptional repressor of nem operon
MKVSREQVDENRRTILDAAGRLFRERGFDAVTVSDVMRAAGLTHGGFYGYFPSKDALIAASLKQLLASPTTADAELGAYAANYLTPTHRDNGAGGCPVAALGADSIRQTPEARAAMTRGLRDTIARLSRAAPGSDDQSRRRAAIGSWSAMVGAMILARMADDPELSDEVLAATSQWIGRQGPASRG